MAALREAAQAIAIFIILIITQFPSNAFGQCTRPVGNIPALQGEVQVQSASTGVWHQADLNEPLCPGDVVRVGARSRASMAISDQPNVRLDQSTEIRLPREDRPWILGLLRGAAYFFSRHPRVLTVNTPFVDGAVEGTEFLVQVEAQRTLITVFEGTVKARNPHGVLSVRSGQSALAVSDEPPRPFVVVRPEDAVQWALYYPAVLPALADPFGAAAQALPPAVRDAVLLAARGELSAAFARFDSVPAGDRGSDFHLYRAGVLISIGRVEEAQADIRRTLVLDPASAAAYALRVVIAVAQNRIDLAMQDALRAVELNPRSASAKIALSYAQQAQFQIEAARQTLQQAVKDEPENALAWARLSELWLMLGYRERAVKVAKRARKLAPQLARAQTVLGFAALAAIDTAKASRAFRKAIAIDSGSPLPHFGLGLATIRDGQLAKGTEDIEIAVALDPNNSLLRSYLGKAYFDDRTTNLLTYFRELIDNFPDQENTLSTEQFAIAKQLDPKDPTPWLYDAIRLQSENRPVEALRNVETSIALNDNRAVYRSRELLDEDRAARGSSLARIYNDLGFQQLGITEATTSLGFDPSNAAAHRFLSDVYATRPRYEIARASELLQAQLLQDINLNPVQPSLSEADLNIIASGGPARPGFNEFTPLFERNSAQLNVSGLAGTQGTYANEAVLSGTYDQWSVSAGQLFYSTDGFRRNADSQSMIYNLFAQTAVSPRLNVQAEVKQRSNEQGDLSLRYSTENYSASRRRRLDQMTGRVGVRFSPTPHSHLITSFIYSNLDRSIKETTNAALFGPAKQDGYQSESQYVFNGEAFSSIPGFSAYEYDAHNFIKASANGQTTQLISDRNSTVKQYSYYLYNYIPISNDLKLTIGGSYDYYDHQKRNVEEYNPKLGVEWSLGPHLVVRAAAFQTVKPALVASQTIQPTQVAGFNQFYDDRNGTRSRLYGLGVDARIADGLYAGISLSRRNLDTPPNSIAERPFFVADQREDDIRGYVYLTIGDNWALSAQIESDRFTSSNEAPDADPPLEVATLSMPLSLLYFDKTGFFGSLGLTYVYQDVVRSKGTQEASHAEGDGSFAVVDLGFGFRLPERRGLVGIEINNLFDEKFKYQDDSFRELGRTELRAARYLPERTFLARATLNF